MSILCVHLDSEANACDIMLDRVKSRVCLLRGKKTYHIQESECLTLECVYEVI